MKKNYRYVVASFVLTLAGFAVLIACKDPRHIFGAISQIGWRGFLWLCCFSMVNYILRYQRWKFLLGQLGDRIIRPRGLVSYFTGFALTTTPAKAGEAIRCLYFHRREGIHYGHTLAAILTERTTDAIASMLIAGLVLYGYQEMRPIGIGFTGFILAIVVMVAQPWLLSFVTRKLRCIPIALLQKLLDLVPVFQQRAATLFTWRPFLGGIAIACVAWSAEAYAFAWLAQELGGNAGTLMYMSIFALAMVAGALTFMPGGIGGAEAVLILMMKATGMGDAEAITATLLCRLATLWFAVALGLLSIAWLELAPDAASAPRVHNHE